MDNKVFLKFLIWLLCLVLLLDAIADLLIVASTVANVFALVLLIILVWASVSTKCFTTINFKKNRNEESN